MLLYMRILVQDILSGKYLTARVKWTSAPLDGRAFPTTGWAYDIAHHVLTGRFRVVLHFPESGDLETVVYGVGDCKQFGLA
jgi:hypothetical protein